MQAPPPPPAPPHPSDRQRHRRRPRVFRPCNRPDAFVVETRVRTALPKKPPLEPCMHRISRGDAGWRISSLCLGVVFSSAKKRQRQMSRGGAAAISSSASSSAGAPAGGASRLAAGGGRSSSGAYAGGSGFSSSLTFTPIQGIELCNPDASAAVAKTERSRSSTSQGGEARPNYFSSSGKFVKVRRQKEERKPAAHPRAASAPCTTGLQATCPSVLLQREPQHVQRDRERERD